MKLKEYEPQSLSQAVAKAMKLETLFKSFERQKEASKPRLARSAQPEEKQNKSNRSKSRDTGQFNARTSNTYNKSDNAVNEQKQTPPWKNKDASTQQSKENNDLKEQVRQLSNKLSE